MGSRSPQLGKVYGSQRLGVTLRRGEILPTTWTISGAAHGATWVPPGTPIYPATWTASGTPVSSHWVIYENGEPVLSTPENVELPVITGTTTVGQTLSCSTGVWTGDEPIAYTYLWLRDGVPIGGATNSTYLLTTSDYNTNISCQVTGTNSDGSGVGTAAQTALIAEAAPVNTVAPVASGYVYSGKVLSVTTGTWTSITTPTYTYQWKRNGSNIASATSSTYSIVFADLSQSITCEVTATNTTGGTAQASNALTNWTPTSLTLSNWYDFADNASATYNGSFQVSQLNDLSGNSRNATQGVSGREPIYTFNAVNGLAVGSFDGVNDRLLCSLSGGLSTFTVLVVAKPARIRQYDAIFDSATGATNDLTCEQSDLGRIDFWDYNLGRKAISSGTITTSAPFVMKWSYDTATMRTSVNNAGSGSDAQISGVLRQSCSIGGDNGSGGFYNFLGYICEVLVAPSLLDATALSNFQTYAQNKWGTA